MAESYIDLAIKRQAILERIKSGQVRDFNKVFKQVEKLIKSALINLDGEVTELGQRKLAALIRQLEGDIFTAFTAEVAKFSAAMGTLAVVTHRQELLDLRATVDVRGTKLDKFTKKEVFRKVVQRPLNVEGQLLKPWIDGMTVRETKRVGNAIRLGHANGKTNQELVRQIIGTKSANYKNGILNTSRRNASTVVRTSVQHVASSARQETWEANQDVITAYQFLATLDRKTSAICRHLDKQLFEFGEGPIPPIHPNCRSTTLPKLAPEFDFLSKGRTRSGEKGPVSADTDFYGWLKNQPKATQVEVLGPTRAKLFRDGGMSAEKFRRLQFDKNFEPLTLAEMRQRQPKAFELAGL